MTSPTDKNGLLFLCRASGDGSHNFRVAADEAGVLAFYEEMFGKEQDGTLDNTIAHFRCDDNWGNSGTVYECELYCAKFEVWKVHPSELVAPRSAERAQQTWCPHVGGLGPPFPFCEICARAPTSSERVQEPSAWIVSTSCDEWLFHASEKHKVDAKVKELQGYGWGAIFCVPLFKSTPSANGSHWKQVPVACHNLGIDFIALRAECERLSRG